MASSSGSKRASKYSPGDVGASEAGTVKRRLESSVTIMVGLSHQPTTAVKWRGARAASSLTRAGRYDDPDAFERFAAAVPDVYAAHVPCLAASPGELAHHLDYLKLDLTVR